MCIRQPHLLTHKNRNPPIAVNTLCRELAEAGLHTRVREFKEYNKATGVTFKSIEAVDLTTAFRESQGSEISLDTESKRGRDVPTRGGSSRILK